MFYNAICLKCNAGLYGERYSYHPETECADFMRIRQRNAPIPRTKGDAEMNCEDCGTRMYGGICPNCQEELYIFEEQGLACPASEEFMQKVKHQAEIRLARKMLP